MSHAEDNAGTRRDFLYYATAGAGAVATGAAVWPLINQMNPAADTVALSSIEFDLTKVAEGSQVVIRWQGKPVFVAYPAGFDFLFVYWYLMRFVGESPFSHSALDMKTYAMALLKTGYRDSTKRRMPRDWFDPHPHTHVALDDAIEQGALFCNMLRANLGR